ncbi:MAG: energy transducer TonB [Acidobacteria bacterium]|nr:energy transducer TonB [Acidobacteriota bacterium]
MKKIFLALLTINFLALFVFAQNDKPVADWQELAPAGEEFRIEVPAAFKAGTYENPKTKSVSRSYVNLFEGTFYYIMTDSPENPVQMKMALNFAYEHEPNGSSPIVGGFEARKFVFSDNDGFFNTILIVNGKNRYYVFQTASPIRDDPSVVRFFSSLRFGPKEAETKPEIPQNPNAVVVSVPPADINLSSAGQTIEEKQPAPVSKPSAPPVSPNQPTDQVLVVKRVPAPVEKTGSGNGIGNGDGRGNGTGNGRGQGNGEGSGDGPANPPKPPIVTDTPVKILSKPRANYTDYARFYQVQGSVTLRVVFSANGSISSIAPITRLPFGLTQQAIIAAKQIRFEPATRNGIAYSVSKPVVYNFTIY